MILFLQGMILSYIDALIHQLKLRFEMTDLDNLKFFLGLEISRSSRGLMVHQAKYTRDVLQRFGMLTAKSSSTPLALHFYVSTASSSPCSEDDAKHYRALIGALHYLTFSRPNVAFAVSKLSPFMHHPTDSHLVAAKHVLRYLGGSIGRGLLLQKSSTDFLRLTAYSDSDWAGDPSDRRSTSSFVIFLGQNPISWGAKKRTTISRSSTEAEYRSLASAAIELSWVRQLLKDLCIFSDKPPLMWCDNISAIQLAHNSVFHGRTKHVDVVRKDIVLHHVPTEHQLANLFTKPLIASRL